MKFEKLIDSATDSTLLEPDWETILTIVDGIRSGELPAKPAIAYARKKCSSENPHSALHALMLLEAMVKNCSTKAHQEVATREFMEDMKHLAANGPEKVKEKVLELIQMWAHAFRDKPEYSIVKDTVQLMKMEGFHFPPLRLSDAHFISESAPDWVDADHCYRCRVPFGILTRKHHCRNCGQIFCDKCSSRTSIIPKFGIEKEVRVCETCFDLLKNVANKPAPVAVSKPLDAVKTGGATDVKPPGKSEEELREEEELQLALAMSQSEQEEKERLKKRGQSRSNQQTAATSVVSSSSSAPAQPGTINYRGTMDNASAHALESAEEMSELARYLNRQYWEHRKEQQKTGILRASPTPSAPIADNTLHSSNHIAIEPLKDDNTVNKENEALQNGEADEHLDFVNNLRGNIDIFVNRIRSNQARGRSILNDNSIQSLFMTLTSMHSELLKHMQQLDDKRSYFEGLHDKLSQIKDAREAVNALREEHELQRQRELEEQQRIRQIQMVQKLEVMRQKKHEYFEHQRILALQRMQEQEREIQMRKQQQQYMAAQYGMSGPQSYPGAGLPIGGPSYTPNQQLPYHQPMAGAAPYAMQSMMGSLPQMSHPNYQQQQQQQQQFPQGGGQMPSGAALGSAQPQHHALTQVTFTHLPAQQQPPQGPGADNYAPQVSHVPQQQFQPQQYAQQAYGNVQQPPAGYQQPMYYSPNAQMGGSLPLGVGGTVGTGQAASGQQYPSASEAQLISFD